MTTLAPPKPTAQPNLLHQQILGDLLANRMTSRQEQRSKQSGKVYVVHPETGDRYTLPVYTDYVVEIPVPTLAGHVSLENVERAAERWLR